MGSHNYSTDDDLPNTDIWEQAVTTTPFDEPPASSSSRPGAEPDDPASGDVSLDDDGPVDSPSSAAPPLPLLPPESATQDLNAVPANLDDLAPLNGLAAPDGAGIYNGSSSQNGHNGSGLHTGAGLQNGSAPHGVPDELNSIGAADVANEPVTAEIAEISDIEDPVEHLEHGLRGDDVVHVGAFDRAPRPPVRRVIHPFDVPGPPGAPLDSLPPAMVGHEPPVEEPEPSANRPGPPAAPPAQPPPPPSGSVGSGGGDDSSPARTDQPAEQFNYRNRTPDTGEVPVVEPLPLPHTSSTSLISGGIGEAPVGDPVDQIAVRKLGGFNFLSVHQWMAVPRDEKARLIKGELVIFLYEGEEVSLRAALLYLQNLNRDGDDRW